MVGDLRRARRPGRGPRRRHRPVRRRQRRRRLRRARRSSGWTGSSRSTRTSCSPSSSPASSTTTSRPRSPSTASGTRPTRPARPGRRSAATSRPTPAALCCLKYGVTRDYVLGLEVVAGDAARSSGSAGVPRRAWPATTCSGCWSARRARSGSSPRSPCGCGRCPPPASRSSAYFDNRGRRRPRGPGRRPARASRPRPSSCSTAPACEAVEDWKNLGLAADAEVLLLGRVDTPGEAGEDEADRDGRAASAGRRARGPSGRPTRSRPRRCSRPAGWPTRRWSGSGRCSPRTSACPGRAVPEMLGRIEAIAARHGVEIATIAHAGDGNLHPLLLTRRGRRRPDGAPRRRSRRCSTRRSPSAARSPASTASACSSAAACARELSRRRRWRCTGRSSDALDPRGIFNPGKVIAL